MASINFLADLQEMLNQELSNSGYPSAPEETLDTVLMRYLNLYHRIPPVLTWTVKKSRELSAKSFPDLVNLGLEQFIQKAESGQSLKSHLSIQSDNPDYKDLMFYDWGVFHFHLGTNPHPRRTEFVERTDDLLFAIADSRMAQMYLIDIHPHHGGFTNQDLLKIIENNWPEILEPYTLSGVIGLTYNVSDNDIGNLRRAGIAPIIQTPNGRCLASMGGGITAAGTSIRNRREADRVITTFHQLEKQFIQQKAFLADYFKSEYGKDWTDLTFKIKSFELPLKVEETRTGEIFTISTQ